MTTLPPINNTHSAPAELQFGVAQSRQKLFLGAITLCLFRTKRLFAPHQLLHLPLHFHRTSPARLRLRFRNVTRVRTARDHGNRACRAYTTPQKCIHGLRARELSAQHASAHTCTHLGFLAAGCDSGLRGLGTRAHGAVLGRLLMMGGVTPGLDAEWRFLQLQRADAHAHAGAGACRQHASACVCHPQRYIDTCTSIASVSLSWSACSMCSSSAAFSPSRRAISWQRQYEASDIIHHQHQDQTHRWTVGAAK